MCALGILRSMSLWQDQRIFFYPFKEGCIKYTLLQQSSIPDMGRHKDCRCSQTGFQKSLFRTLPDTACPLRRIIVDGNLDLFQYNYPEPAAGYASGGYMSEMTVTGNITSGT